MTQADDHLKRGPLSKDDRHYIERWYRKHAVEQIALHLNRSVEMVAKYVASFDDASANGPVLRDLRQSPSYDNLRAEFTPEELVRFEQIYVEMATQFGIEDLQTSERFQLHGYIKMEIRESRLHRVARRLSEEQEAVQDRIDRASLVMAENKPGSVAYKDAKASVGGLHDDFNALGKQIENMGKQLNDLDVRKTKALESLKGTRQQRIKILEDGRTNFPALLKELMYEDRRSYESDQMKQISLAMEKEKRRLAAPYKFADGLIDQPLLTPETVEFDGDNSAP